MSKKPIVNALGAVIYIVSIVSVMHLITTTLRDKPDTFFAPAVFLSLVTLSASVMAYLFFYQPIQLLIDGKRQQAVALFVQTIGVFGLMTVVALGMLFAGWI